jgi:hypothetical protein
MLAQMGLFVELQFTVSYIEYHCVVVRTSVTYSDGLKGFRYSPTAVILNLVLFWYQIVLFDIFINCGCYIRYFMPVLSGKK